jgi:hypothetical protein
MSKEKTIKIRQSKLKQVFIAQLKRTPTIELACEKTGVARTNIYRWMRISKNFAKEVESALIEGRIFISDIAESQIFSLIKDKKFEAIRFWLSKNNPRYGDKLELTGIINNSVELSPQQEKILREALKLALPQNNDKPNTQNKSAEGNFRADDKK